MNATGLASGRRRAGSSGSAGGGAAELVARVRRRLGGGGVGHDRDAAEARAGFDAKQGRVVRQFLGIG